MDERGLLSGIRVIDCGTYVAGPASATVMSDFGAEVIKIERPGGGDLWRIYSKLPGVAKSELDWCWVLTSRNKKNVALELGRPEGLEVDLFHALRDQFGRLHEAESRPDSLQSSILLYFSDLPKAHKLAILHDRGYGEHPPTSQLQPSRDRLHDPSPSCLHGRPVAMPCRIH